MRIGYRGWYSDEGHLPVCWRWFFVSHYPTTDNSLESLEEAVIFVEEWRFSQSDVILVVVQYSDYPLEIIVAVLRRTKEFHVATYYDHESHQVLL